MNKFIIINYICVIYIVLPRLCIQHLEPTVIDWNICSIAKETIQHLEYKVIEIIYMLYIFLCSSVVICTAEIMKDYPPWICFPKIYLQMFPIQTKVNQLIFVMRSYYMGLSSSVCRHYSLHVITLDNLCFKTTFINISVARFNH